VYKISGSWEILALCEQPPVRMLSKGGGWQEEARGWVSVSRAWVSARQELRLGSCSVSSGSEEGEVVRGERREAAETAWAMGQGSTGK